MDADLLAAWRGLAGELGADQGWARETVEDLARRYAEAHRAYHTLAHVREVLAAVDALVAAGEPVTDPAAVRAAAWFHDAVYEPGAAGNERRSAELAVAALRRLDLAAERVAAVAGLVADTADHVPRARDAPVLLDADLAILAARPRRYAEYVGQVRAEYSAVAEPRWRAGRAAVLDRFLARPSIYATARMRERGEAAARRNLTAEREKLT